MAYDDAINKAKVAFGGAVEHMKSEFSKLQVGRAHAGLLENLMVEMYGSLQPLKAVANISVPDAKTLQVQPWDKAGLHPIEKAITDSGLGLNPVNTGLAIMINMPPMTEERRADVVKHVKGLAEDARISVRTARQDAHNAFKQMKDNNEMTEDDVRSADKQLQESVDASNKQIDEAAKAKEQAVMTV
ncbi:ribosome recycling factor [Candidatus Peregrinibacteria bacterium]|jgi:ribosome recycling factor|nr:ribosome recycling factor [Candidatus Peregrinibacteria bacterium]MBT4055720.1 ribosome recycling factor [Candidatus Peregrinibacteria bacterium]